MVVTQAKLPCRLLACRYRCDVHTALPRHFEFESVWRLVVVTGIVIGIKGERSRIDRQHLASRCAPDLFRGARHAALLAFPKLASQMLDLELQLLGCRLTFLGCCATSGRLHALGERARPRMFLHTGAHNGILHKNFAA